ncbi:MAG: ABC transporter substrate-binding protein [Bacteroidota bacterium]
MKITYQFLLFFLVCLSLNSCKQSTEVKQPEEEILSGKPEPLSQTSSFEIINYENFTWLSITTPWQGAEKAITYIAYKRGTPKPEGFDDAIFIETPIRSLACNSTTHVAMLDFLESTDVITGMAGTKYVYNEDVRYMIDDGKITELGLDRDLDYEKLITLNPDVVLTYSMGPQNNIDKIKETGLAPVVLAEFLDASPLGRAEWVKFLAVLLEKQEMARVKFEAMEGFYNTFKSLVVNKERPTVMVGMGYEGTWYVPAGGSYVAKTIEDAGGNYLWKDKPGSLSLPLDFEAVYDKAKAADKWINVGQVNSLKDITSVDERYGIFEALTTSEVYNGNARVSEKGGYDIYESAVVNPHLVLRDLVKAFHPDVLPEEPFVYYKRLD